MEQLVQYLLNFASTFSGQVVIVLGFGAVVGLSIWGFIKLVGYFKMLAWMREAEEDWQDSNALDERDM